MNSNTKTSLKPEQIWEILDEVKDPEIPVVSVVEMGMIRSFGVTDDKVVVNMTPTFIGCPAIEVMKAAVQARLLRAGAKQVEVNITHSPPWSTGWITSEARRKLKDFGLASPPEHNGKLEAALTAPVACPYCDSNDTTLTNSFGPTLCRAIYVCNNCRQPFEQFKPI